MPRVNLLPKEELETKPFGRVLKWSLSYGRYIIITVELVVFLVFFSRFIFDRQLADLNDDIEQKQAIIASAQEFEKEFRAIQDRLSYVEILESDRRQYMDLLSTLKRITPQDVVYQSIEFGDGQLTLEGIASNNEGFAQFLAQIKNVDEFSVTSLDSLSKEEEEEIITFSVAITYETATPALEPEGAAL